MSSNAITRRRVLASGASATAALALSRFVAATEAGVSTRAKVLTFHDARFPRARALASELPGAMRLQAVDGDPSSLSTHIRPGAVGSSGVRLQGVTTESLPFCLEQLARHHYGARFESRRLDRDLFVWSLTIPGELS